MPANSTSNEQGAIGKVVSALASPFKKIGALFFSNTTQKNGSTNSAPALVSAPVPAPALASAPAPPLPSAPLPQAGGRRRKHKASKKQRKHCKATKKHRKH